MLSMIQQSARKTLNVNNRIGVADSKLATLKLSSTAKTSNVLSLIRGNSAPATNIKVDLTLPTSNDTTATLLDTSSKSSKLTLGTPKTLDDTTAANITVETADDTDGEFVTSVTIKNGDGTTTTITPTNHFADGKVNITRETLDTTGKANITPMTFDTTGKANVTPMTLDTFTTNNTAPDKLFYVTDTEPVIVNLDVANFHKNFVTDDTPATGDDTTTPNVTPEQIINSAILNSGNAAQEQVNNVLGMLDDTNETTTANINLPSTLATKSQELNDLANGNGNWGGSYQSDLLDDNGSNTFTGTTSLPQMDLDSLTQPSSAGTMPDVADEMTKATQNNPMIANAKAMQEQANQQQAGVLQLLQ